MKNKQVGIILMALPNKDKPFNELRFEWVTHEEAQIYREDGFKRAKKLKEGIDYKKC